MGSCVAVVCGHNVGHGRQHVKSVCFSCTLGSKTMGNSVVMLCLQPMALFDLSSEVQPSTPWTVCHSPNAATHRMPTIVIMTALSEAFHSADRTVCTAVRSSQDFYISFLFSLLLVSPYNLPVTCCSAYNNRSSREPARARWSHMLQLQLLHTSTLLQSALSFTLVPV